MKQEAYPIELEQVQWSALNSKYSIHNKIERLKVPGGWLVRSVTTENEYHGLEIGYKETFHFTPFTFLPDSHHTWILEKEEN